jgi:PAS domain S-box-containing protein
MRANPNAQAALAAVEVKFRQLVERSLVGIYVIQDGRFVYANPRMAEILGCPEAEITSRPLMEFIAEADRPVVREYVRRRLAGEVESVRYQLGMVRRGGEIIRVEAHGGWAEYNGRPAILGTLLDITEQHKAETALRESERRHRTTLDKILEGCQLIDFNWRYLYLNDAAALHNRRPNAELLGRTMPECWPGIGQTLPFRLIERCLKERTPASEEVEFVFADGSKGWFDMRVQPVEEGALVLSVEITERKQAEMTLRVLNQTLEQEVVLRTEELRAALVRAEAADRLKSAFLATMSHELRTPLNSIIGFTGIVFQGLAGPLTPEQGKQLGMVRASARHLLDLINDVLDISKIEAGQLEVRAAPFDLGTSLERAVSLVRPLAEKKGLTLKLESSGDITGMSGDHRRVEQVLINLLNNAIKFTDQGGVTLTADILPAWQAAPDTQPRPAARLRITDTGIGIKAEDLAALFRPFHQVDTGLARQHEGTGLGLAICRRLATLMGGDISVTSEWGKGSVFTLTLPLQPAPAP